MKIVLNCVEDLQELIGVLDAEFLRTWQPSLHAPQAVTGPADVTFADLGVSIAKAMTANGRTVVARPEVARAAGLADEPDTESQPEPAAEAGLPTKDADGAPHNTDWHSDPAKINADGTWRARRKRDEAAYKDWLLSLAVEVAEAAIAADDAEPVATETHALPQDEPESAGDPSEAQADTEAADEAAPTVDHAALIEASQEAAENAPDGTIDLLNAGKEFIKEYGTAKFEALKSAVCPTEDGKGKAIPSMEPAERRLMRACMDNYALYL